VVPFKFRLGGDKGITASSTIAPYVGFRMAFFQGFGLSFTPLISGGLGLVPVTDQNTNTTETKSALSLATGFIMTSSKNERFNAGILIGKDVLSKTDRERDPNVDKAWLSFYLGVSM
jgi:Sec-independent protein secretion pathway component TatC